MQDEPTTLMEAIAHFSTGDNAHNFIVKMRWPNGVCCPRCQSTKVTAIATRKTWECKSCTKQKQFSVRVGTIMEDSLIPLPKWLAAFWLLANSKNGVSSWEIHRSLGLTQKSAWFLLQRIRLALKTGSFEKFKGTVESDESYIGGKSINMHPERRMRLPNRGLGGQGKAVVHGLLERGTDAQHSRIKATVVPNARKGTIKPILDASIEPGSNLYTDTALTYLKLDSELMHKMVDHAIEYVNGQVHTNGLENFWSLLKRSVHGTYVAVEPVHLERYIDEQVFRFNNRGHDDRKRFCKAVAACVGKRLTYSELTGKDSERAP